MLSTGSRGRPLERCATAVIHRTAPPATLELARLAISLALLRKKKAMRASGRPITPRAVAQWRRTNLVDDVDGIVAEAARRVAHFVPKDSAHFLRSVAASIRGELANERRSRGRPKQATGLLASSSTAGSAKRGRRRAMTTPQERAWAKRVLRTQVELFRQKHGFLDYRSAREYLVKRPTELRDIPATSAIAEVDPTATTLQLRSLSTRYRRALTTFRLWPPSLKK